MRFFITGGCGFLGSNLGAECFKRGHEVFVFDNLSREGAAKNLDWLRKQGSLKFYQHDIKDQAEVDRAIAEVKPDVVFHLAGQVAMTTSLVNPRLDFETNVIGGHNVLEAVRKFAPQAIVTYSSTNKVYGDLGYVRYEEQETRYTASDYPNGFDETTRLDFQSPYGCSKGATDQYMLDYARLFGLKTIVFRHSTIFGGRQFSTFDQGWVGWFVQQAIDTQAGRLKEPFTIAGTGKQVRDVLFASDLIECYFSAIENIDQTSGRAFNMGGGISNSLSLLELFKILEQELDTQLRFNKLPWRVNDQKIFVADTTKSKKLFGFTPKVGRLTGIKNMIEWIKSR